ncbi:SMC-Scp complex subunit ScpB [Bacilliculturomica massiliensis]|uniref:SMC-Scp complex subunit ScpB n=1 Tax=Bacilliculturomica massiliensis TaxID=1917867 RepID=UPI001030A23D|nr:SMC-Scp complex subunit ScpB [Bacilliculturomica massiliensis]
MTSKKSIKSALESMMFVWGSPLDVKVAAEMFNMDWREVYDCFRELQEEYESGGRGIVIREISKSFQFCTRPENSVYIERLCTPVKEKRLSQSALEVLAIIAYKQPVTKGEIEAIRGIKCDRVIEGLTRKGLIEEKGRSNAIGRPILYGTTKLFLEGFGFSSLKELPDIDDIGSAILAEDEGDAEDSLDFQQIAIDLTQASGSASEDPAGNGAEDPALAKPEEAPEREEIEADQPV